jgi:nucleotide-binding universal stress UspA family protein
MDRAILVSTDGSEYSEGAVKEAINIAKLCGSKLYSMSVIDTSFAYYPNFLAISHTIIEDLKKELSTYLEGIKDKAAKDNVKCEIIIRDGEDPYKLIIEEADKRQAGLIVMGRRGSKGLMRILLGSTTSRVIGHASCKVLVVPRASSIKWKHIVLTTDGSKHSEAASQEAINLIKNYCKACTLNVIAIVPSGASKEMGKVSEDTLYRIKSKALKENIKVDTLLIKDRPHESIHESIIKYAKNKDADIIFMGSHGRSGLNKLLMGSVAERVIGYADLAVLVVR